MTEVKKPKLKSNKIIVVLTILLVCSVIFMAGSITYSKYVQSNVQDPSNYTASEVYIDSNILKANDASYPKVLFNAKDTIRLYNYSQTNVNLISNYAYAPSCTLTYLNGTTTLSTTSQNGDEAFKFKANVQDEYAFTLTNIPSGATSVKIQCGVANGINQVVTGELTFEQTNNMEYEIKDDGEGYITLYLYTNGSSSTSLTINYDPSKYVPDNTDSCLASFSTTSGTITDLEPYTGYKVTFLKTSDLTSVTTLPRTSVTNDTILLP